MELFDHFTALYKESRRMQKRIWANGQPIPQEESFSLDKEATHFLQKQFSFPICVIQSVSPNHLAGTLLVAEQPENLLEFPFITNKSESLLICLLEHRVDGKLFCQKRAFGILGYAFSRSYSHKERLNAMQEAYLPYIKESKAYRLYAVTGDIIVENE